MKAAGGPQKDRAEGVRRRSCLEAAVHCNAVVGWLVAASRVGSGVAAVEGDSGRRIGRKWKLVVEGEEGSGGGIGSFVAHVLMVSWYFLWHRYESDLVVIVIVSCAVAVCSQKKR